jgi:small subunit ribosomal protein S2
MVAALQREYRKVKRNLEGIRTMERMPGALIVVDPVREKNAVREAAKLEIPVVALADTEADPDRLAVVIPGNDDAMRAVEIVLAHLADAVVEGKANRAARAVKEGEGQVLDRSPSRPRTRGTRQPPRRTERKSPEMPLPKPHPASRDAVATDAEPEAEPAAEKESASESPGSAPAKPDASA